MTAGRAREGRAARRGAAVESPPLPGDADVLALAHRDWLYHHLLVTGDADLATSFRQAAMGPGVIP